MRIISGEWKGRRLKAIKGNQIRPTSDKVKGAIFNILGDKVLGSKTLDLFAGTGSLSLEALSRGAAQAVLVEKNRKAWEIIGENLQMTGVQDRVRLYHMDAFIFLKQQHEKYDLIFVDPPYGQGLTDRILSSVKNSIILNPAGVVILETASNEKITDDLGLLEIRIIKEYGDTKIWFLQQRETQEEV